MRNASVAWFALFFVACLKPSGPELPPDVGATRTPGVGAERIEERAPEPEPEPVEVGTLVWGNFHDTGFYFHGVVVDRREDMHRVIYTDGASEWLPASALLPDSLREEAQIHVRTNYTGEFRAATVARRLGQALYVRLSNGDERWVSLPHVRFQVGDRDVPRRGEPPVERPAPGELGSDVLVDYQLEGLMFAGVLTALDEERLHVVYLDGESQWVAARTARPDDVGPGAIVHVRRSWEPAEWVRGRVEERIGPALRILLDDGGVAWTSMFRIRVPLPEPGGESEG